MLDLASLPLRPAIGQFNELTDEQIAFALQCGVQDVLLNTPHLPGDERWEFKDLLRLRMRAEERGRSRSGGPATAGPQPGVEGA